MYKIDNKINETNKMTLFFSINKNNNFTSVLYLYTLYTPEKKIKYLLFYCSLSYCIIYLQMSKHKATIYN